METQTRKAPAPMDRWRIVVVCYLVWVVLFTVVEGVGRKTCNMPMRKWIAAAVSPRDRTAREWFRDRAKECLDRTRWYSYSMFALVTVALVGPFVIGWVNRKRLTRVLHGALIVALLAATLGTMEAVRWIYDWMG
jgi:hypothetical protein